MYFDVRRSSLDVRATSLQDPLRKSSRIFQHLLQAYLRRPSFDARRSRYCFSDSKSNLRRFFSDTCKNSAKYVIVIRRLVFAFVRAFFVHYKIMGKPI